MLGLFNLLDRGFDALARPFDDRRPSETPRSRPQVAMILLALALAPIVLMLGWDGSPWLLGLLGLMGAILFAALYPIWTR